MKKYMVWYDLQVVVQLANLSNFICTHEGYCHPNCYERQRRSCQRLTTAIRKVYEATATTQQEDGRQSSAPKDMLKDKLKRRVSL